MTFEKDDDDKVLDWFAAKIVCECGYEFLVISAELVRRVAKCPKCGIWNDRMLDDFFMSGTMEDVIEYMESEEDDIDTAEE